MTKEYFVLSDLHMGCGPLQDFSNQKELAHLIDGLTGNQTLVLNGDVFDFAQTPVGPADIPHLPVHGKPRLGTTESESTEKLRAIVAGRRDVTGSVIPKHEGHPTIFARLRAAVGRGVTVYFLAGNHDVDVLWPEVARELIRTLGDSVLTDARPDVEGVSGHVAAGRQVHVARALSVGGVQIHHGHQQAGPANYYANWSSGPFQGPFLKADGIMRLDLCWGSRMMALLMNHLDLDFPYVDNIRPLSRCIRAFSRTNERALSILWHLVFSQLNTLAGQGIGAPVLPNDIRRSFADALTLGETESAETAVLSLQREFSDTNSRQKPVRMGSLATEDLVAVLRNEFRGLEGALIRKHAQSLLDNGSCKAVICGHTHEAIPFTLGKAHFINTGTWIPYLKDGIEDTKLFERVGLDRFRGLKPDPELFDTRLTYARFACSDRGHVSDAPELRCMEG